MPGKSADDADGREVARWIERLKHGDQEAAAWVWEEYHRLVLHRARRRMGGMPRSVADEDDVAVDVFAGLCAGAAEETFRRLESHDDLLQILSMLVERRIIDQRRYDERHADDAAQSSRAPSGSHATPLNDVPDPHIAPDALVAGTEFVRWLSERLPEGHVQQAARLRFAGLTNAEAAARLGVSERGVEKMLASARSRLEPRIGTGESRPT